MGYAACDRQFLQMAPNLFNNSASMANMGADVVPASAALKDYQSAGSSLINSRLNALGYAAPAGSSAEIYPFLGQLEVFFIVWQAEAARSSPRTATGERTRADMFRKMFQDGLDLLGTMDLSRSGLSLESTADWYIGGISVSEKSAVESDTDRIPTRFGRGQFENDAVRQPTAS